MNFSSFTNAFQLEMRKQLPGIEAQKSMAPYNRPTPKDLDKLDIKPKNSAVLILFYPIDNVPYFCLTQRLEYKGAHSGQVCLPGGGQEKRDLDLQQTALREAQEEIGIDPNKITIHGELTKVYVPPSNFLISPYVGSCAEKPDFIPEESEVKEIIEVRADLILDETIVKRKKIEVGQSRIRIDVPYFDLSNKIVWGATAVILAEVKALMQQLQD